MHVTEAALSTAVQAVLKDKIGTMIEFAHEEVEKRHGRGMRPLIRLCVSPPQGVILRFESSLEKTHPTRRVGTALG